MRCVNESPPAPIARTGGGGFGACNLKRLYFRFQLLASTFSTPGGESARARTPALLRHADDDSGEGKRQPHARAEQYKHGARCKQRSPGHR